MVVLFAFSWFAGCSYEDEPDLADATRSESTDTTTTEPEDTTGTEPMDTTWTDSVNATAAEPVDTTYTEPTDTTGIEPTDTVSTGSLPGTEDLDEFDDEVSDGNGGDDTKGNGTNSNPHRRRPGNTTKTH